jgi:hypothetical protein
VLVIVLVLESVGGVASILRTGARTSVFVPKGLEEVRFQIWVTPPREKIHWVCQKRVTGLGGEKAWLGRLAKAEPNSEAYALEREERSE